MATQTNFFITVQGGACGDDLVANITAALSGSEPVTNEALLQILLSLVECTNNCSTSTTGGDGVVTGVSVSGNTITLTRSNGLPSIVASLDISTNTSITTLTTTTNNITASLNTAISDIADIETALTTLLTTVARNNTLTGNGTVGSPLGVAISTDVDNQLEAGTDGGLYVPLPTPTIVTYVTDNAALAGLTPVTQRIYTVLNYDTSGNRRSFTWNGSAFIDVDTIAGSSSLVRYRSGNLLIEATGTGVTYSLSGNIATITIPLGVIVSYLRINETYGTIGNNETFLIEVIDNNLNVNLDIDTYRPHNIQVLKRDVFSVNGLPDGAGSVYPYEAGNRAVASRAGIEVYNLVTASKKIVYRLQGLGVSSKWSVILL